MPGWDSNNPKLDANLVRTSVQLRRDAVRGTRLTGEMICHWHSIMMDGLEIDEAGWPEMGDAWRGAFRGSGPPLDFDVGVPPNPGAHFADVAGQVDLLLERINTLLDRLDTSVGKEGPTTDDELDSVANAAAFAHAEWIRIHPFANGNGRTARLIARYFIERYGLPRFLRIRPRPDGAYGRAGAAAMTGDWKPTAEHFRELLREHIDAG